MKKYIGIFISVLFLVSCDKKSETVETNQTAESAEIKSSISLTDPQLKNISIDLVSLENGNLPTKIRLSARTTTTPQDQISVTNMLGGFVKSITVLPGNSVKEGQVIAVLEDPNYVQLQEDYLTTKALIIKSNADYNRQKELNASQAASTKVLEEARAELSLLQIKQRALEEKLRLINLNPSYVSLANLKRSLPITAPVSGIVNTVFVNRGQYVSNTEPILEIIQTNKPILKIKAFENDLPLLKLGLNLEAFSNTNRNDKLTAKIIAIPQSVNSDGSIDVLAQILNSNDISFTANMYFNVELTTTTTDSKLLPIESVVHFEGKDYVFESKSKNNFELVAVTIGNKSDGKIEILSPLNATRLYVGKGAYSLLMALKNNAEE